MAPGAVGTIGVASGALIGAASGFAGGLVGGAGNTWLSGGSIGEGFEAGLNGAGFGALSGGVVGGVAGGIRAYNLGADNVWNGKITTEYIVDPADATGLKGNAMGDQQLNNHPQKKFGVKQGDWNITKLTSTETPNDYTQNSSQQFLNSEGRKVAGVTIYVFGNTKIYISPWATTYINQLEATLGHELIHAYHHYIFDTSTSTMKFNNKYSEHVAHKYSYGVHAQYQNHSVYGAYHKQFMAHHLNYYTNVFPGPVPTDYVNPFPLIKFTLPKL